MLQRLIRSLSLPCLAAVLLAGCANLGSTDDLDVAKETQQKVMAAATGAVPPYEPSAFPARVDINRYLKETELAGEWYTYALNWQGEPIFYVVSDSKPRNICVSITAPDRKVKGSQGNVVMSAPALDGVYYGGADCNSWYLWDATTGTFIELSGQGFSLLSTRAPLLLETDPVQLEWDAPPE